jgi:hypothetical protein
MGCGCKKQNASPEQVKKLRTESIKNAVQSTIDKYYNKNKKK